MRVVILGSGNVAGHLAKALRQNGVNIVQIFGRNEKTLRNLSLQNAVPYSTSEPAEADIYLIAVKDAAIEHVAAMITSQNCIVAHTSGSLPLNVLKGPWKKGVFYPLQTFSQQRGLKYSEIPFFIEAESATVAEKLTALARKISPNVSHTDFSQRRHLHLAAVFTCNFVNHLYSRAKEITDASGVPFQSLLPLIRETAGKIEVLEPRAAQTGPAVRNDQQIIKMHEDLLPPGKAREIYQLLSQSIAEMYEL